MIDRRKFIALMSSGVAASAASMPAAAEVQPALQSGMGRRPNVIFLICDDLGYGDLGSYGSQLPTPNLDRVAAHGLRFTHFNAGHPICSASRAAVLTGRYGTRSKTTGAFGPTSPAGTSLDETLLSELFRAKGYRTKAIGKWHLGDKPGYLPTSRGFDSFYGVPYSDDMQPLPLIRDEKILEQDTDRTLLTPRYTEEALKFIDAQQSDSKREHPFFLYLGFSYPHDPAKASPRFRGKTGFGDVGDAIAEIDWSVGEIVSALERKGLTRDTLLCFTSDHGPWYQGNPGPLRGRKASTFEGGFRVPFLATWPGTIAAGKVVDDWCSNLDVLPTMAALCDLDLPKKPLDGIDISKVLLGGDAKLERKPVLYFSPMGAGGNDVHCIRRDGWKLRVAQNVKGEMYINDRTTGAHGSQWLPHPELYDLSRDPAESYDQAKLHPELIEELMRSLEIQMQTFPPNVVAAYTKLKQDKGDVSTPPGASPRPAGVPVWGWTPPDRRS